MSRKLKDTGWFYYLPENGETKEDAKPIKLYWFRSSELNAEAAADYAAEDEWDNRDGWEAGIDSTTEIAVIAPDGMESRFCVSHEAHVSHLAELIEP